MAKPGDYGSRRVVRRRQRVLLADVAALVLCAAMLTTPAMAADPRIAATVDPAQLPPSQRGEGVLLITARQAHAAVTAHTDILLIDVRTHGETVFNGVATLMHRHIPYVQLDADHTYDAANRRYKLESNPDFVKAFDNLLTERKQDRRATIIVYCSVGERSARAANLLVGSGFTNVYSVVDGFEGDGAAKLGPGWKAGGLPWTSGLSPAQVYRSPSM